MQRFLTWTPGLPSEEERKEIKKLFEKAAFVQWHPETEAMAEILRRIESDSKAKISASEVVNIDIEFTFFSREVLQIGIVDLEGSNVGYFPKYSEGVVVSSSSPLPAPPTWQ